MEVYVGEKHKTPVRLIANLLTEEQALKRKKKKSSNRKLGKDALESIGLNLFITKIYDDSYEAIIDTNGNVLQEWTYIAGPDGKIHAFVLGGTAPPSGNAGLYFTVCDHLGSPNLIANHTGEIVEKLSFNAWGMRRNADTWALLPLVKFNGLLGARGYTFHEHLDEYGLINMNGRLYDPLTARFLQPDPVIQDALNTQNYNAYSYVFNNPFKYTDPDGRIAFLAVIAIGALIGAATNVIGHVAKHGWNFKNFDFGSLLVDTFVGALSGVLSFGVGQAFVGASKLTGLARIGAELGRAGAHGLTQAYTAAFGAGLKGQDFTLKDFAISFATGSLSSVASSGLGAIGNSVKAVGKFSETMLGNMAFGGLMGGATSAVLGGDFFDGFATGAIVSGLNHGAKHIAEGRKDVYDYSNITESKGGFIESKKAFKNFMNLMAKNSLVEVAAFKLKGGRYFVQPWKGNLPQRSFNCIECIPGYSKFDVRSQYHTHPQGTVPFTGLEDFTLSKLYGGLRINSVHYDASTNKWSSWYVESFRHTQQYIRVGAHLYEAYGEQNISW